MSEQTNGIKFTNSFVIIATAIHLYSCAAIHLYRQGLGSLYGLSRPRDEERIRIEDGEKYCKKGKKDGRRAKALRHKC